ncbi:MAG: DNA/RNA nuclease SfsA [Treponema sp.]|jgi:sugar fermentation stimulation protein A|nr:DNA/RNA nuclease SfsA [Treponema sp.]
MTAELKAQGVKLFSNDLEAVFLRRPNRFLIIAEDKNGREIPCHCPNPGRLIEFVFPGTRLILEKRRSGAPAGGGPSAKTAYTAAGLYYHDGTTGKEVVVPLFSARANKAAEFLILRKIIPGIKEIQSEYAIGNSRFDFCCTDAEKRRHLVEVKACSLVEYGTAMFPDAPSERALKHLEELAVLSGEGYTCHVLFVIVHSAAGLFIPNLHTDPEFSAGLSRYGTAARPVKSAEGREAGPGGGPVLIHAALLRSDNQGNAVLARASVPVDLSYGKLAESDKGSYLIILHLKERKNIEAGSLGPIHFKAGWYVYAGSAMKNLKSRISRHQRKIRKQKHWHLDYLTAHAQTPIKALPFLSRRNLECELSAALAALGGEAVRGGKSGPGFGASDCSAGCAAHLWYFAGPPMQNRAFVDLVLRYRHRDALR